uniref:Glutaredoxin-like protein n=1 Tax=Biomphalaria glabrata TaxID=6526 RepID=A0A2C9KZW3_BIOGL
MYLDKCLHEQEPVLVQSKPLELKICLAPTCAVKDTNGFKKNKVILEKIDITAPENRRYWKSYRYDIPVFHLNGKFIMKHRANIDVFNNELKEYYLQVKKETETT